jgi:hypothetical protein
MVRAGGRGFERAAKPARRRHRGALVADTRVKRRQSQRVPFYNEALKQLPDLPGFMRRWQVYRKHRTSGMGGGGRCQGSGAAGVRLQGAPRSAPSRLGTTCN